MLHHPLRIPQHGPHALRRALPALVHGVARALVQGDGGDVIFHDGEGGFVAREGWGGCERLRLVEQAGRDAHASMGGLHLHRGEEEGAAGGGVRVAASAGVLVLAPARDPTDELVVLAGHHLDAGLVAELDADAIAGREGGRARAHARGALGVGFGHLRDASGARFLVRGRHARRGHVGVVGGGGEGRGGVVVRVLAGERPAEAARHGSCASAARRDDRLATTRARRDARRGRARDGERASVGSHVGWGAGQVWLSCRIADADATSNVTSKLARARARDFF